MQDDLTSHAARFVPTEKAPGADRPAQTGKTFSTPVKIKAVSDQKSAD